MLGLTMIVSPAGHGVVAQQVIAVAGLQHPAMVGTGQHDTAFAGTAVMGLQHGGLTTPGHTYEGVLCPVLAAAALGESTARSATPSTRTPDATMTLKHRDTTLIASYIPQTPGARHLRRSLGRGRRCC
jgi:hypothetical protein